MGSLSHSLALPPPSLSPSLIHPTRYSFLVSSCFSPFLLTTNYLKLFNHVYQSLSLSLSLALSRSLSVCLSILFILILFLSSFLFPFLYLCLSFSPPLFSLSVFLTLSH